MLLTSALVTLLAVPAQPAPGNDNTVFFDGLLHDSASTAYVPNGTRMAITDDVVLRLRAYRFDLTAVTLEWWDGNTWAGAPMAFLMDVPCGPGFDPPYTECVLWDATVPGIARALAYRFAAQDGSDTNYVGAAAAGTASVVFNDGEVPTVAQSFALPAPPDAGPGMDASMGQPDAGTGTTDAAVGMDAAVAQPDAAMGMPDAAMAQQDAAMGTPDAAMGTPDAAMAQPDAAMGMPDAAMVQTDAAVGLDASVTQSDAATGPDAAQPMGQDGGSCTAGCASETERRVCSSDGRAIRVACTAGTQCADGVCVSPGEPEPEAQGCSCAATPQVPRAWPAAALLLALGRVFRRRR